MSARIDQLTPEAYARAEDLLRELHEAGIPHVVTSTRRTTDEQVALYCQGRAPLLIVQLLREKAGMSPLNEAENRYTVTNADGVHNLSRHQSGKAIDIVPATEKGWATWDYIGYADQYKFIGLIARRLGWVCGQDWPPIDPVTGLGADPPHYELA